MKRLSCTKRIADKSWPCPFLLNELADEPKKSTSNKDRYVNTDKKKKKGKKMSNTTGLHTTYYFLAKLIIYFFSYRLIPLIPLKSKIDTTYIKLESKQSYCYPPAELYSLHNDNQKN